MVKNEWLEVGYYKDFKCKCGECRHPCCNGWNISITRDEYFRLVGIESSNELRRRLDVSFLKPDDPTPNEFMYLSPNYFGSCHMLDDDGLCMLQKECGEASIPEVCRVYPRNIKKEGNRFIVCCTASCEKVVELLMNSNPINTILKHETLKSEYSDDRSAEDIILMDKCFDYLKNCDDKIDIKLTKICTDILGIEDANDCCDLHEVITSLLRYSEVLLNESFEFAEFFDSIKTKLSTVSGINDFINDREKFEKKYPEWDQWFENLLLNNFIYSNFPYTDDRVSAKESAKGLSFMYALMRLFSIEMTIDNYSNEKLVDILSGLFHLFEHTSFYYNSHVMIKKNYLSFFAI